MFTQNVQLSHQEALLYVFEDNEAVIKMITKGRSPTMRHVSRTHSVALDWLFDRVNLDPKIQIKYIDTRNQLADMLTKRNFTRDEWNHLLCLFNVSHFSSTVCSEVMSKRTQQDSGEERVTAKSRRMMSLIAKAPSTLSSSASKGPDKRSYESQSPWSAKAKEYDRTGQPVVCPQRGAMPQQFIIGNDETESELSVESRSFLNRVNDQVRKRQKRSSMNVTENDEEHTVIRRMFMSVALESAVFMGKNYSDNWHSIKNTKDLTMIHMFDISAKLVSEQDEIYGVKTIDWEGYTWKYLSLIGDEQVISLQRTKVYVFSDSVLCLGKILENPQSNTAWEDRLAWFRSSPEYRDLDRIDGEPMEFEWNIFPRFNTLQLSQEVKSLLLRLNETPENFTGRIIFMSMFNDISCGSRDNEKECGSNANLVSLYARRFGTGQWSFIGPGSEKKWYSISEDSPQGEWDRIAEKMMLEFGESRHPVFRATSPLSRCQLKSTSGGKLSIHKSADLETIKTVFRTSISCKSAQSSRSSRRNV